MSIKKTKKNENKFQPLDAIASGLMTEAVPCLVLWRTVPLVLALIVRNSDILPPVVGLHLFTYWLRCHVVPRPLRAWHGACCAGPCLGHYAVDLDHINAGRCRPRHHVETDVCLVIAPRRRKNRARCECVLAHGVAYLQEVGRVERVAPSIG